MKKFTIHLACFLVIICCIDFMFGYVMDYMNSHARGGGVAKRYYIAKESKEDILLFGSSRMSHHYDPFIIEDSLGMSCYNCGEDGNGIILSYGYLKMILQRYVPKMIIYDISGYDIYQDDNMKYISFLKPYAKDPEIKQIITKVSPNDKWKLYSNLYRYNSICVRNVAAQVSSEQYDKGYIPLKGVMNYSPNIKAKDHGPVDTLKMYYLKAFINECTNLGVKLVFIVSPRYKGYLFEPMYKEIRTLCQQTNIPYYDFYGCRDIAEDPNYFQDQTHMNTNGASLFTKMLIQKLKL